MCDRVFILEGILTVLIATAAPFVLPDDPATCSFLTAEEKAVVVHRLRFDTGTAAGAVDAHEGFRWAFVRAALLDYKVWCVVVVYWGSSIPIYGWVLLLLLLYTWMAVCADDADSSTRCPPWSRTWDTRRRLL